MIVGRQMHKHCHLTFLNFPAICSTSEMIALPGCRNTHVPLGPFSSLSHGVSHHHHHHVIGNGIKILEGVWEIWTHVGTASFFSLIAKDRSCISHY